MVCGDYNTAHQPMDLARPKENEDISGFLPMEREWLDRLAANGFLDTFRVFNRDPGHYSWWDMRTGARERNVGWRIDYHFISENLKTHLKDGFILPGVMGSDHCPVSKFSSAEFLKLQMNRFIYFFIKNFFYETIHRNILFFLFINFI